MWCNLESNPMEYIFTGDKTAGPVGKARTFLCKCFNTGHNFYETDKDRALDFLLKYEKDGATVDLVYITTRRLTYKDRPSWLK